MDQRTFSQPAKNTQDTVFKSSLNIAKLEKTVELKRPLSDMTRIPDDISRFRESLEAVLTPNLPAKELVTLIVRTALETEFGKTFTLMGGFDKMVLKISDSIMTDPALRRQALSVVSTIVDAKMDREKKN